MLPLYGYPYLSGWALNYPQTWPGKTDHRHTCKYSAAKKQRAIAKRQKKRAKR